MTSSIKTNKFPQPLDNPNGPVLLWSCFFSFIRNNIFDLDWIRFKEFQINYFLPVGCKWFGSNCIEIIPWELNGSKLYLLIRIICQRGQAACLILNLEAEYEHWHEAHFFHDEAYTHNLTSLNFPGLEHVNTWRAKVTILWPSSNSIISIWFQFAFFDLHFLKKCKPMILRVTKYTLQLSETVPLMEVHSCSGILHFYMHSS